MGGALIYSLGNVRREWIRIVPNPPEKTICEFK